MKIVIALAVVALIVVGALFLSVPPSITVAPEHIFTIAGLKVTNTMFTKPMRGATDRSIPPPPLRKAGVDAMPASANGANVANVGAI